MPVETRENFPQISGSFWRRAAFPNGLPRSLKLDRFKRSSLERGHAKEIQFAGARIKIHIWNPRRPLSQSSRRDIATAFWNTAKTALRARVVSDERAGTQYGSGRASQTRRIRTHQELVKSLSAVLSAKPQSPALPGVISNCRIECAASANKTFRSVSATLRFRDEAFAWSSSGNAGRSSRKLAFPFQRQENLTV